MADPFPRQKVSPDMEPQEAIDLTEDEPFEESDILVAPNISPHDEGELVMYPEAQTATPHVFEPITDAHPWTNYSIDFSDHQLRNPQRNAIWQAIWHFCKKDAEVGLIQMPTGSGKTHVMLLMPFVMGNGPVLIVGPKLRTISNQIWGYLKWMSKDLPAGDAPDTVYELVSVNHHQRRSTKRLVSAERTTFRDSAFPSGRRQIGTEMDLADLFSQRERFDVLIMNIDQLRNVHSILSNPEKCGQWLQRAKFNKPEDFYSFFSTIILDEAHHAGGSKYDCLAQMLKPETPVKRKTKLVAFTATPWHMNWIKGQSDPQIIYKCTLIRGIKDGFLRNPELQEVTLELDGRAAALLGPIRKGFKLNPELARIIWSDKVMVRLARETLHTLKLARTNSGQPDFSAVCTAADIPHAIAVTAALKKVCSEYGIPPEKIICNYCTTNATEAHTAALAKYGFTKDDVDKWQRAFKETPANYDVLVQIDTATEGYDNPKLIVCSFFAPPKSLRHFAQLVGRVCRRMKDIQNSEAYILGPDLFDLRSLMRRYHNMDVKGESIMYAPTRQSKSKPQQEESSSSNDVESRTDDLDVFVVETKPNRPISMLDIAGERTGYILNKAPLQLSESDLGTPPPPPAPSASQPAPEPVYHLPVGDEDILVQLRVSACEAPKFWGRCLPNSTRTDFQVEYPIGSGTIFSTRNKFVSELIKVTNSRGARAATTDLLVRAPPQFAGLDMSDENRNKMLGLPPGWRKSSKKRKRTDDLTSDAKHDYDGDDSDDESGSVSGSSSKRPKTD